MPRTARQRTADDNLTEAIEEALAAYREDNEDDDGEAYILTEYVVLTAATRFNEDGDGMTSVGIVYRDGDVPPHRALGLLEHVATRMRAFIAAD